jgi:hypothetical protein
MDSPAAESGSIRAGGAMGCASDERYQVQRLLPEKCAALGSQSRLWLAGYRTFREHHHEMHALLERLQVPHEYCDGPDRAHDWNSGWVSEAVAWLFSAAIPRSVE